MLALPLKGQEIASAKGIVSIAGPASPLGARSLGAKLRVEPMRAPLTGDAAEAPSVQYFLTRLISRPWMATRSGPKMRVS
jgi:hypothetical protein